MKNLISAKLAGNILLAAFGLLAVFHVLVLLGVIPAEIVWGGMIRGVPSNLITLEIISLLVTLLFIAIIAARTGAIPAGRFSGAVRVGVWLIFAYLLLNTLGNLVSGVSFENLVFAPVTILLALFAFRLTMEK